MTGTWTTRHTSISLQKNTQSGKWKTSRAFNSTEGFKGDMLTRNLKGFKTFDHSATSKRIKILESKLEDLFPPPNTVISLNAAL
jgi:hypothetical protein